MGYLIMAALFKAPVTPKRKISGALVLCLAMLAFLFCSGHGFTQDLVGSWPFNGNANDESGFENHGTVTGATLSTDRFGNPDSAYRFDGVDDVINCGNDTSLQTADVTAMCWIKTERDDAPWAPTILVKSGKGVDGYVILDGGQYVFAEPNGTSGWQAFGVTSHTVGQWHHLAYVYDSSTQQSKFYKDGTEVGSLSFNMATPTSSDLKIGYGYNTLNPNRIDGFQGSIDDVRIYNRALSGAEIAAMLIPEIAVEQPSGTELTSGSSTIDFGTEAEGYSVSREFTIRNTSNGLLTGLGITFNGTHASEFSVTTTPTAPVASGGSTTFTVEFSPTSGGTKTAALHIANNDNDENPFDVNLTARGLALGDDTDSDGMNDAAEFKLALLGFDWEVSNNTLVNALNANAGLHGLYTESQIGNARADTFTIGVSGGTVTLGLQLQKSEDLIYWEDFGAPKQWTEPAADKAFYRLFFVQPETP